MGYCSDVGDMSGNMKRDGGELETGNDLKVLIGKYNLR